MILSDVLMLISICSGIAALIIGWKLQSLLWYYALASFGADVVGLSLLLMDIPRYWNSNLFMLLQFLLISHYLISESIKEDRRKWIKATVYILSIAYVVDTIAKGVLNLNYEAGAVLYAFFIFLLLWAFYKVIRDIEVMKIEHSPLFIFCSGFLIYVAGSLIILLARRYLDSHDPDLKHSLRTLHHILNILKNAAVAYSLYLYKKAAP